MESCLFGTTPKIEAISFIEKPKKSNLLNGVYHVLAEVEAIL